MADSTLSPSKSDRALGGMMKYSDIVFAAGVVGIVSLLFVRVSAHVMDFLLAVNLAVSVTVLVVALFVPTAARLPSFPTVLLLATLFRLALNISSTRLILLEANAGKIIYTFGDFVVGGNYVVGGVIFALLSIIQLIVISKGAERASEVTARFISDAVPGKQMAIDADLQRNEIDHDEARRRRQEVERESKLYGALTGAMHFVKGDAIAGIIISLVNIVGGLIVGVAQQGMAVGEAAQVYSLLTVGDGLVTQIAAMLTSLSAGLIITRVSSNEEAPGRVAQDILGQILAHPRALMIVAALLALIGLSQPWTGFPMVPFLMVGGIALAMARLAPAGPADVAAGGDALDSSGSPEGDSASALAENAPADNGAAPRLTAGPLPLVLEIHPSLRGLLMPSDPQAEAGLQQAIAYVRGQLAHNSGVSIPLMRRVFQDGELGDGQYCLLAYGAPLASGSVATDHVAAIGNAEHFARLASQGLKECAFRVPGTRVTAWSIPPEAVPRARQLDMIIMHPLDIVITHLMLSLRRNLAEFISIQTVSDRLNELEETGSLDLVKHVVKSNLVTVPRLTEILKRLARERVPVGDLRLILESVARWAPKHADMHPLVEAIRGDLRRPICSTFAATRNRLEYYLLDPDINSMFRAARRDSADGPVADLAPENRRLVAQAIASAVDPLRHFIGARAAVVLTDPDVRPLVRDFVFNPFPEIVVLARSRDQLVADLYEMKSIGTISLG